MNIIYEEDIDLRVTKDLQRSMEKIGTLVAGEEHIDAERVEIALSIVDADTIQKLNGDYRGKDKVTDVLSFPQYEDLNTINEEGEILLGDVVICLSKVEEQAKEYGHTFERELLYLFTHSVLHLVGYDHINKEEKEEMRLIEKKIMEEILIV